MSQDPSNKPECPRCGYDLSGALAAMSARCELDGSAKTNATCTECGLCYRWGEVLNTVLRRQAAHFEGAAAPSFRHFLKTFLMLFLPWRLWRAVEMHHVRRPMRLAVFVPIVGLLSHLAFCALLCITIAVMLSTWGSYLPNWCKILWPFNGDFSFYSPYTGSLWQDLGKVAENPSLGSMYLFFDRQFAQVTSYFQDVTLPPSPLTLLACGALLMPLCFSLLPQTRRRCKVRSAHILRIALYQVPTLPLLYTTPLTTGMCLAILSILTGVQVQWSIGIVLTVAIMAWPLAWVFIWWRAAIRWHLRMPRASLIALLLLTVSMLATLAL